MQNIHPKYKLIGHRGVAGLRPENTLCSFEHAATMGLNWIEFDVQLTNDQQWIVIHDETVERTTNGRGKVTDYTLANIEQLDAGLWYQPPYPGQHVPTLIKTIKLAEQLGLHVNIEIKGAAIEPEKYAQLMVEFIHDNHIALNQILISSFDLACIIEIRSLLPKVAIGYLIDNFNSNTIAITKANNFTTINCDVNTITENDLNIANANNIPVMLYTVNDKKLADLWLGRGVVAIFTDRPDLVL